MYETLEDRLRRLGDTLPEPSDAHTESSDDCYFRLQPKPAELAGRMVVGISGRG